MTISACSFSGSDDGDGDAGGDGDGGIATWPTGHKFRKTITVKARDVGENVDNFVLAIFSSTDSDLNNQSGDDFLLQNAAGENIDFELEPSTEDAFALWTRINLGTTAQTLYLYYDGPKTPAQTNIWPENAKGAVWHGTVEGTTVVDSTPNKLDATPNPPETAPALAAGIVGQALDLNTDSPRLTLAETDLDQIRFGTNSFSYSVWVNVPKNDPMLGNNDQPWRFKKGNSEDEFGYEMRLGKAQWFASVVGKDSNGDMLKNTAPFGKLMDKEMSLGGKWTQLVAVIDQEATPNKMLFAYANGARVNSLNLGNDAIDLSPASGTQAYIGGDATNPFVGLIDELRITDGVLSAAEIKAQYDNLTNTDAGFFTIGKQETPPAN